MSSLYIVRRLFLFLAFASCLLLTTLLSPEITFAQEGLQVESCDAIGDITGEDCIDKDSTTFGDFLSDITRPLLRLLVIIASVGVPLMIIVGGARYVLSAGAQEKTATAKKTITGAVIGLAILLTAQLILSFVLNTAEDIGELQCEGLTQSNPEGTACVPWDGII